MKLPDLQLLKRFLKNKEKGVHYCKEIDCGKCYLYIDGRPTTSFPPSVCSEKVYKILINKMFEGKLDE